MNEREKFIEMLKEDPKLQEYHRLEEIINKNKNLKAKLGQLKALQKQLINTKKIEKTEAVKLIEADYEKLLDEIMEYPLMTTYLDLQNYFNELLKQTADIIESNINNSLKI